MTVEQLAELHTGDRKLTEMEAISLYDMLHQTEVAKTSFELHGREPEIAKKFAEAHKNCRSKSALSEKFQYTFIPGGIGNVVIIKCLICGEEKNITDYDIW